MSHSHSLAKYGGGGGGKKPSGKGKGKGKGTQTWTYSDGSGNAAVVQKEKVDAKRMALQIDIDASGSMGGSRIQTAARGLETLAEALRPTDLFGVATFDTTVKSLHRIMERSKVKIEGDVANVKANQARGGATSFYDAVVAGVKSLNDAKDYLRSKKDGKSLPVWEHVVITDGGDNMSSSTFQEACETVKKPGLWDYQFVVIGVGLDDSTAARLETLCRPGHCHFHREADASALSRRLEELTESYKLRVSVQKAGGKAQSKVLKVATAANADAITQSALVQMAQLSLGGAGASAHSGHGGGGGGRRALHSSGGGGHASAHGGARQGTAKCRFDKKCTKGASCTFKHSSKVCHFDISCTKHPQGTCMYRHTFSG